MLGGLIWTRRRGGFNSSQCTLYVWCCDLWYDFDVLSISYKYFLNTMFCDTHSSKLGARIDSWHHQTCLHFSCIEKLKSVVPLCWLRNGEFKIGLYEHLLRWKVPVCLSNHLYFLVHDERYSFDVKFSYLRAGVWWMRWKENDDHVFPIWTCAVPSCDHSMFYLFHSCWGIILSWETKITTDLHI